MLHANTLRHTQSIDRSDRSLPSSTLVWVLSLSRLVHRLSFGLPLLLGSSHSTAYSIDRSIDQPLFVIIPNLKALRHQLISHYSRSISHYSRGSRQSTIMAPNSVEGRSLSTDNSCPSMQSLGANSVEGRSLSTDNSCPSIQSLQPNSVEGRSLSTDNSCTSMQSLGPNSV
jgi:hypothetical protein